MRTETFYAGTNRSDNLLHIETDGCIVNIRVGLHDADGNQVTAVSVSPDDESRGGDGDGRVWHTFGPDGKTDGAHVRVVCGSLTTMADSYGQWRRPAFGELHTAPRPGRTREPSQWLAREGAGDYRRPVPMMTGKGTIKDVPADHRDASSNEGPARYVARRNGLPDSRPDRYGERRPGWATRNLDLAAIRAADRQLSGKGQRT